MAKYIPLDDLVVEIENRIKSANNDVKIGAIESLIISKTLNGFKSFLNTIEVKEVDLDLEISAYIDNEMKFLSDEVGYDTLSTIAKHFFELGMAVSNKVQKED